MSDLNQDLALRRLSSDAASFKEPNDAKVMSQITDALSVAESEENVGLSQFEAAKKAGVHVSKRDNRRISRMIDLRILPLLCLMQGVSYLEKSALNYGNLYGMKTALDVTATQFSWFTSIYFFGYLVGNYPQGWLLQRFHSGKTLACMTLLWGIVLFTIPACTNFSGAMAAFFFLGFVEAIVTPGLTLLTSIWYSQSEVPLRSLIWLSFNGWGGIFGSFVSFGIGNIHNPAIPRWQYFFFILAAMSVALSVAVYFFLPDSTVSASFLNEQDKILAIKRVAEAKNGVKNKHFRVYQAKQALLDPKTWLLFIAAVASHIPMTIITNFSSVVIKGMGFTTLQTTLLSAASSGVEVVSLLIAGWICTRWKNMRIITATAANITCIIAAACLTYLPTHMRWNRLVAYWFASVQTVGFSLSLVMISNNIGGFTKRTFTTALIFVGSCVGSISGPHFIKASEAPRYRTGTEAMLIGYVIKTVALALLGIIMFYSNVKRDRSSGPLTEEDQLKGEEAGMHDLTEFENPYHRYVL